MTATELPESTGDTLGRIAALAGISSVAITQPVLDLFGRNPEFFVAGRYTSSQIVGFAIAVALVPATLWALLVLLASRINRKLGAVVYTALLAVLGAVLALAIMRTLEVDDWRVAGTTAVAVSACLVVLERRFVGVRLLLRYLAFANVLFLGGMLFASPTAGLLESGATDLGEARSSDLDGPVVVLVLDELPVTTLMLPDGSINADRYPAFAELADRSTWFRNASSLSQATPEAVPQLLSGKVAEEDVLPTYQDHPRNLLTLLGRDLPVHRYEVATDLCAPQVCDPLPPEPLRQAFSDAAIVYGHRVLPGALRSGLPAIDHSWGGFGAVSDAALGAAEDGRPANAYDILNSVDLGERSPGGQLVKLRERIDAIRPEPAVHLVHVLAPHYPWLVTPWGAQLMDAPELIEDESDPARDWSGLLQYQMHSMQAGALDDALGALLDHLGAIGAWDDTTLVVTADHGTSLLPPDFNRDVTENNREEIFRIPLFIKAPGQTEAEVRDDVALSIDIIPTLVDLLRIETDWTFDGHSLVDGSRGSVDPLVTPSLAGALDVVRRHAADTPHGSDWLGLAAIGEHGGLLGRQVSDLTVGVPSDLAWSLDRRAELAAIAPKSFAPQVLVGSVAAADRPPELVVGLNGTLAGVVGGYQREGGAWRFGAMLGLPLAPGANEVIAYEVERRGDDIVLHPLDHAGSG